MILKIAKFLWIGVALVVLLFTLYSFDGQQNSDIGIFFAWYMLFLSFPGGLLVSLAHFVLYEAFSITVEMSYLSLIVDWAGFFAIGYVQWFKLLPYIVGKLRNLKRRQSETTIN